MKLSHMALFVSLVFAGIASLPDSALADDRTVWKATDGTTIKRDGDTRVWRVFQPDGTQALLLVEVERTAQYVMLYEEATQKHLRVESGQLLVAGRHRKNWTKTMDGNWVGVRRRPPGTVVTSVWLFKGGKAGYRFEGERIWKEYAADGRLLAELEEQDRGPKHVLLYVKGPSIYLRLEPGQSLTKPRNGGTFVKSRDGDWSRKAPSAWPKPVPKEVVTDIWLVRGGRAGYRFEGERTWREYAANGNLLAELEEQDRGPSHVLLYVKGRDIYLRLEPGKSLTKPRNGGTFVKNRDGDWSRRAPRAWPPPAPKVVVTDQWLTGNGRAGFRKFGNKQWREYDTAGKPLATFTEVERTASHVLLHDPAGGAHVRLESGRCLIRQRNGRTFVPRWTGKWGRNAPSHWRPPQPEQPQGVVTDIWLVVGGLSGFRKESDGAWREYSAGGKAVNILTEQERGVSHVLLYNQQRDAHLRLERDRCHVRHRGKPNFVPQWNGGWARNAPTHWRAPDPRPQVVVTSVWLMQGGRSGFLHEGGQTWREYGQAGRPLNLYAEQERGASHVLLSDAGRGIYLRLEPGRCFIKLRGHREFSPQWSGNWSTGAPTHWQLPSTKLPEIWLLDGGGGYRREGSPPVWVAYGPDGRAASRFVEESRTADYVQILEPTQGLRMRLLAGELQTRDTNTGRFVRRATGNWSARAPANWPVLPDAPRFTSAWVYVAGGGFRHAGGTRWIEHNQNGTVKRDFVEKQRTDRFVLLHHAGRDLSVRLEENRCLALQPGMAGWTILSEGGWVASVPAHWRTDAPSGPGIQPGGTTSLWKADNGDLFRNESGKWMHYAGRILRLLREYVERSRTTQYVELWNSAEGAGFRLFFDRNQEWHPGRRSWIAGRTGGWVPDAPYAPGVSFHLPKTFVIPLLTESVNGTKIGNQTPHLVLRVARAVGRARDGRRYVHVGLDKSTVSATRGALTDDREDRRGYYLEEVKVVIESADGLLTRHSDGPPSFGGKGVLSSISGVNLITGGSVGVTDPRWEIGRGNKFGRTYSERYVDFHVVNGTRGSRVEHAYKLATVIRPGSSWSRNGGTVSYRTWRDLVDSSPEGALGGNPLCGLPPRCSKSFPLISQATFEAPANFAGVASIRLTLHLVFRHMKKEGRFLNVRTKEKSHSESVTRTYLVDFGDLN